MFFFVCLFVCCLFVFFVCLLFVCLFVVCLFVCCLFVCLFGDQFSAGHDEVHEGAADAVDGNFLRRQRLRKPAQETQVHAESYPEDLFLGGNRERKFCFLGWKLER